jgi:hypothetical protein
MDEKLSFQQRWSKQLRINGILYHNTDAYLNGFVHAEPCEDVSPSCWWPAARATAIPRQLHQHVHI